jgi:intracellular multiplication protein IcmE
MAGKKDNIKALFSNTRTRVIILFTIILLCSTVVIGFLKFSGTNKQTLSAGANVKRISPGLRSIPGALDPTAQYAGLQEQQNVNQAETATKKGGSAIPTLIRTQRFGEGVDLIGGEYGEGSLGFTSLSKSNLDGSQKGLWIQALKDANCSRSAMTKVIDKGGSISVLHDACSCAQLRDNGYTLPDLVTTCSCPELKAIAFTASELKALGYTADKLRRCGFSACETRGAEFSAEAMREGGFSEGELKGAGFSTMEIAQASGLPNGLSLEDISKANCEVDTLKKMRGVGVSAAVIQRGLACSAANLKAAGFSAAELKRAGMSAAALLDGGFNVADLKQAGYSARDLLKAGLSAKDLANAGFTQEEIKLAQQGLRPLPASVLALLEKADKNNVEGLRLARAAGVSAGVIRGALAPSAEAMKAAGYTAQELKDAGYNAVELNKAGFSLKELKAAGFSAEQLKAAGFSAEQLRAAGYTPEQLKAAGYTAEQLKAAGFSAEQLKALGYTAEQLKAAGFSAEQLKAAGYTAEQLKAAGFSAEQLKALGYTAEQLKAAGFSAEQLKAAGYTAEQLKAAGFSAEQLRAAGFSENVLGSGASVREALTIDNIGGSSRKQKAVKSETKELQALMARQKINMSDQRNQEKVKRAKDRMLSAANDALQGWKKVSTQVFIEGSEKDDESAGNEAAMSKGFARTNPNERPDTNDMNQSSQSQASIFIKTGDILFAVLDTSVNTDEPGPILATIVSGKLKGSKIIGSFTLPSNAEKMVLTFNTLSMLGSDKTVSISSYAIDPSTARTALAGRVNHHYLMRYGSLFASTFLAGFSSAIQSADTTITVGGTGGVTDTTVQNGINRSLLENTLIGLGEVGKAWSETAQQLMSRPTTVELYSGTGMGILFTQDVQLA